MRYEIVEANENHGIYIIDSYTSKSVCDFYFMGKSDGFGKREIHEHPNAKENAEICCKALNEADVKSADPWKPWGVE